MSKKYIIFMAAVCGLLFYVVVLLAVLDMAHMPFVQTDSYKIVQATDTHYLSKSLRDNGKAFQRAMRRGDGKLIQRSPEIFDAFAEAVKGEKPNLLILTGDLAYMGETESHRELAGKLAKIEDAGIPVIVIPGNHDINSPKAMSFQGDKITKVASPTEEEFVEIYKDFGYGEAQSRDKASLSYVYALSDDTWILAVDVNGYAGTKGTLKLSTLRWIKDQLEEARSKDINVISISHQNVVQQNKRIEDIYTMSMVGQLRPLYRKYGVHYNLSGHMHYLHHKEAQQVTDFVTSSLVMPPCQYAVIEEDGYTFDYQIKPLEMQDLNRHENFNVVIPRRIRRSLRLNGVSDKRIEELTPRILAVYTQYYEGCVRDFSEAQELLEILENEAPESKWYDILRGIVDDKGKNYMHYKYVYESKLIAEDE